MKKDGNKKEEIRLEEEATAYSFDEYYTYEEFKDMFFDDELGYPELIDGSIYFTGEATTKHQLITGEIFNQIFNYLKGKKCKVFGFNTGIILQRKWKKEKNIPEDICFKPDVTVVCNPDTIKERGIHGSPTIAIEIISKGTKKRDLGIKYELYEENGVKEYWIIYPETEIIEIHYLDENGEYSKSTKFSLYDEINVDILGNFKLKINKEDIK